MSVIGWVIYVFGALAVLALWGIPAHHLKSELAGVLFLIIALFCVYFGIGTWHAGVFAIGGVGCLLVFWFSDPPSRKKL